MSNNKKTQTVCFTGHRPQELPGKYDWYDKKNIAMLNQLREVIVFLIENNNVDTFITGGALGVDQMAFKVVQKLKETKYPHLKQILAIPFEKQDGNWIPESIKLYKEIKEEADEIVYVDTLSRYMISRTNGRYSDKIGEYNPIKMQKRNEYMVDQADIVIAVYNGKGKGGTYNCLQYAKKKDKEYIVINPNDFK